MRFSAAREELEMLLEAAPSPDLLVSGDGKHVAVVDAEGAPSMLRDRTGDYMRSLLAEASGFDGDPLPLAQRPYSVCTRDACIAALRNEGEEWRLLATRSSYRLDWAGLTQSCAAAEIAVSDRRLPRACKPRWLKLDRAALEHTGGVAVYLGTRPRIETVADRVGNHPWAM